MKLTNLGTKDGGQLRVSKESTNQSIAIFGQGGSGKSQLGRYIFSEAERGVTFNSHNSQESSAKTSVDDAYEKRVRKINVAKDGIGMDLFSPIVKLGDEKKGIEDTTENEMAVVDRVTNMISNACGLADTFKELVRMAVEETFESNLFEEHGLTIILEWLRAQETSFAMRTASKIRAICGQKIFHSGDFFQDGAEIIEFDLSGIDASFHRQIIEFTLDYISRKSESGIFRKTGYVIYLDEAQQLNYHSLEECAIAKLLNMNRKNEVRMVMAMPSMFAVNKNAAKLMGQCATLCFFKPIEGDYKKVASILDRTKPQRPMWKLKQLRRGDFIATGTFELNGNQISGYISNRLNLATGGEIQDEIA